MEHTGNARAEVQLLRACLWCTLKSGSEVRPCELQKSQEGTFGHRTQSHMTLVEVLIIAKKMLVPQSPAHHSQLQILRKTEGRDGNKGEDIGHALRESIQNSLSHTNSQWKNSVSHASFYSSQMDINSPLPESPASH